MIKVLEKNIADKIAAGEVIERPVSIVKELVENSLDSGAKSITVEIKNGGKSYIRVTDDGCGIPKDEVETAFFRHATSKISTINDLNRIDTLGFRGEALASIAAVTRTELVTKTSDSKTGTKLTIHGGEIVLKEDTGCPDGTTIIVCDLFYNTPARLKFMKADNAESMMIIELISQMALAFKYVKFRLVNNGKVLFSTLGDGDRLNTIVRVFPDVDSKNLVSVNENVDGLALEGYISTPAMSKNNRGSEIFFVNGRVVNSKVMERGVNLGYKERLFEGRYPICYLFLDVDPATIDCNIHPNKREVRFDDENLVSEFIGKSIVSALSTKDAVVDAGNLFKETKNVRPVEVFKRALDTNLVIDTNKVEIKEDVKQLDIKELLSTLNNEPTKFVEAKENDIDMPKDSSIEIEKPTLKPFDFKDLKITGTIFDTYITAIDDVNFYLIDQHAAQERVFYEKLVGEYEASDKVRQPLIMPLIINVSLAADSDRQNWLKPLEHMGFTISEFGPETYRITEIPMFMELNEAEDFVHEFIDGISQATDLRNTVVVNKLIMMSCKAAIKAHDKISMEEVNALMKDLSNCINPYSCPHGRPTVIKLTQYEIEKMFKRV